MDQYSTLERELASVSTDAAAQHPPAVQPLRLIQGSRDPLRFPGEDGGKSLAEMAERDLDAALELLAERARYITGASGAAIALREGESMPCRASSGACAPKRGDLVDAGSGLSGESVRTRQILRCDDVSSDPRVNLEGCRTMGVGSALVMPLVRQQQAMGVFELLSAKANAFDDRDVLVLQRLGEMIQTAVEHAEASKRLQNTILSEEDAASCELPEIVCAPALEGLEAALSEPPVQSALLDRGDIGCCRNCGFPVSKDRNLCLDCEASQSPGSHPQEESVLQRQPAFLGQDTSAKGINWIGKHKYLVGVLLVAAAVGIVLCFR
jgi:hypothetical protein